MKKLDYFIQKQRLRKAEKFIRGNVILDIGCHRGELFEHLLKKKKINGDGIDPILKENIVTENYTLFPGYFPVDLPVKKTYDSITLLAVMEHIPLEKIKRFPILLGEYLTRKGLVIITIPSKKVDQILSVLLFFKLINGMDLEHHQDFDRNIIPDIFISNGYKLLVSEKFEMGLNLLFVFEKLD